MLATIREQPKTPPVSCVLSEAYERPGRHDVALHIVYQLLISHYPDTHHPCSC